MKKHIITADGRPFFPLGGQVCNSSAYSVETLRRGLDALAYMHANTAEIPIYWDQVEPEEGRFDFSHVGEILTECASRGLKVVFLWFGTWKNANFKYVPSWVKQDPARFWRCVNGDGVVFPALSPACKAARDADSRAFCALMRYIKEHENGRTVVLVQVENEPGVLHGLKRDYGEQSEALFRAPVPGGLVDAVKNADGGFAQEIWNECGALENVSWPETFGGDADELFNAWQIAAYINSIAEDGQKVHDMPMYTNFWISDNRYSLAGHGYPSGSAVGKTMEIWRWAAPALAFLAPDIYLQNHEAFTHFCEVYSRGGHPLFIPETGPEPAYALHLFTAVADYHAIGYGLFGVERVLCQDGTPNPEALSLTGSFRALAAFAPVLSEYIGTGRLHSVNQKEYMGWTTVRFDSWIASVSYGLDHLRTDHHHDGNAAALERLRTERGRGLLVEAGPNLFYLLGAFNVVFNRKETYRAVRDGRLTAEALDARATPYLCVEEGCFAPDGQWVAHRTRNGDESDTGVWVHPDVGVVKVELL